MCSSDFAIRWSFLGMFSQSYKVTMCFVVSEEEVLYQNYQEKALHNDSDEDTEPKQPQPDEGIVVQYRPIRTSWSQLSVVRNYGGTYAHLSKSLSFDGHLQFYTNGYLCLWTLTHSVVAAFGNSGILRNVIRLCFAGCSSLSFYSREQGIESRCFLSKYRRKTEGEWAGISLSIGKWYGKSPVP